MITFLRVEHDETLIKYNFPVSTYSSSDTIINGYNSNMYDSVNLETYYNYLNNLFNSLPFSYSEESEDIKLYLVNGDTTTTSYFIVRWNGRESDDYTVLFVYATDETGLDHNVALLGGFPKVTTITDYSYDNTSYSEWRLIGDTDNRIAVRDGFIYRVYSDTKWRPCYNVVLYDREKNRILNNYFGGGQPHKTTVVTAPQLARLIRNYNEAEFFPVSFVDPYDNITPSGVGGGFGAGSFEDMGISYPSLPTLSAVDTGFITLYNPSVDELKTLANYMWSPAFSLESFKRLFADPMDVILGCSILPIAIPDGVPSEVTIGNIPTGIYLTRATRQYEILDCGTITLTGALQSALDYSPNTKTTIYLPFIGAREINTDEIMDKTIGIRYHIDILTGGCVCFINSIFNGKNHIMYQFEGNCANQIPITSSNWTELWATIVRVSSMTGGFSAVGGAGNIGASTLVGGMSNAVGNAMASKPRIEHSGTLSGGTGQLGVMTPYLLIESPNESRPNGYNKLEGYPSNITETLGNLSGYTSIESIHLEGINAPDVELYEIETLLRNGVIL